MCQGFKHTHLTYLSNSDANFSLGSHEKSVSIYLFVELFYGDWHGTLAPFRFRQYKNFVTVD
jgi:hypothetical protein